jgi:hypothetical protein
MMAQGPLISSINGDGALTCPVAMEEALLKETEEASKVGDQGWMECPSKQAPQLLLLIVLVLLIYQSYLE